MTEVENHVSAWIKAIRSDRGGEHVAPFEEYCAQLALLIHQTIVPYSPQSKGVTERKKRTLKEMMNALPIEKFETKSPTNVSVWMGLSKMVRSIHLGVWLNMLFLNSGVYSRNNTSGPFRE